MGNETDQAGLIKRKYVCRHGEFMLDVDSRGRFRFYAPDGTQEKGMTEVQVLMLGGLLDQAVNWITRWNKGEEELPK